MFCPNCGTKLADDAAFCSNCGTRIQLAGPSAPATAPAQAPTSASPAAALAGTPQVVVKKKLPIVPIVAVLALIGLAAALFLTKGFGLFGGSGVEVKASVNDYTWEELSAISAEISRAGSEDRAIEVAKKYHLCKEDGTLDGTQTKNVILSGGTKSKVQIIGFNHDDKADGSGKAGITFLFVDVIADHSMNSTDTNDGGWKNSEMRSYLSSTMESILPEELLEVVVPVEKMTNNKGQTQQVNAVSITTDSFWLPSHVELAGVVDEERYMENESLQGFLEFIERDAEYEWEGEGSFIGERTIYDILNEEGAQYKLYRDKTIDFFAANTELDKSYATNSSSSYWWLRSPGPSFSGGFCLVLDNGDLFGGGGLIASDSCGVVPGFCI